MPFCFSEGISLDLAPVAIITFSPAILLISPLFSILIDLSEFIEALPVNTFILFFFIKKFTPLLIVPATFLLLWIIFSKSLLTFSAEIP